MRATNVIPLPDDVSFVQGALLEPLGVALNAVERVHPEPGDTALVMGPGPIGLLMIAVLKQAYGIQKVICSGSRYGHQASSGCRAARRYHHQRL